MARITQVASETFEIEPFAEYRAKGWPPASVQATSLELAIKRYKALYAPKK